MFWNKWFKKNSHNTNQRPKLKPPVELPQQVGRYLIVNLGKDPDWVWRLKAVLKPIEGGKKSARCFRIFDPDQSIGRELKIIDYDFLDAYPEIILFEGEFDKDSHDVSLTVSEPARAA